ncbi:acyltransferase family protein [Atlantibacter hermannii]|uniref:acyltransferase family protein n=1 Tax=Atlantibacter hermannii TaxID=565 RepID=UPI0028A25C7E|nr:acyltransferase [Atlantibacter hermannii]
MMAHPIEINSAYVIASLAVMFFSMLAPLFFINKEIQSPHPSGQNTEWIDGVRGIAAMLVALNHAPLVIINLGLNPKIFYFGEHTLKAFENFGAIGVQIFFCITGMLFTRNIFLSKKEIDWNIFFKKRMLRLIPAYVFAALIALIIAVWYTWNKNASFFDFMKNIPSLLSFNFLEMPVVAGFDLSRLFGITWSLAYEWRFYFALPLLFIVFQTNSRLTVITLFLVALLDCIISNHSSWVYFISGAACATLMNIHIPRTYSKAVSILIILPILALIYTYYDYPLYGYIRWIIISSLFFLIALTKPSIFKIRALKVMGVISYSFYLLHAMFLFFFFEFIHRHIKDVTSINIFTFTMIAGGVLSFTSMASYFSYAHIERKMMYKKKPSSNRVLSM